MLADAADMTNRTEERAALLLAMHDLARANRPVDLGVLAGRLGWGVGRVVRVIEVLDAKGLADRPRCRLTMAGLAFAVALAADASAPRTATGSADRAA